MRSVLAIVVMCCASGSARADAARSPRPASCYDALETLGVRFKRVRRRGIQHGVEVSGSLGDVEYRAYKEGRPLVLDCSLVYSLTMAGRYFLAHGVHAVRYSSAYERRDIRGTNRPSKHSFGLAIDVHSLLGVGDQILTVKDDYEQGLGDNLDCVGDPLTEGGRILRTVGCQLQRSELFRIVLDPDFDADHYNHFHIEALPWGDRAD